MASQGWPSPTSRKALLQPGKLGKKEGKENSSRKEKEEYSRPQGKAKR